MPECNPCCCWNLKDGCITIGIWSLILSFVELSMYTWQTFVIVQCQNNDIPYLSPYDCPSNCPCFSYSPERPPLGGPIWRGTIFVPIRTIFGQFQHRFKVWSIIQMGIFSWQTAVIKWMRDRMENRRVPQYNSYSIYDNRLGGGDWNEMYITPEEKIYMALFIVQILNLITAFALLFASVALIYGIHTSSKFLVWPWFPCILASIICSVTYCVLWWVGNVIGYWLALTVIEFIGILINVYCLICVFLQYRRILKGYVQHTYDEDYKPKQIVYEYRTSDDNQQEITAYTRRDEEIYSEKQGVEGYFNATYEHEPSPGNKVSVYKGTTIEEIAYNKQHEIPMQNYSQFENVVVQETLDERVFTNDATKDEKETEFKDSFTEEWLKNVMNGVTVDEHKMSHQVTYGIPPSVKDYDHEPARRSRSVDAKIDKEKKAKHHKARSSKSKESHRSHRSGSRKTLDESRGSTSSGDEDYSKTDKSRRSRSESGHRHKHHHHHSSSHHRRRHDEDSETKISRSMADDSERASRKDKRKSSKRKDDDSKKNKRPRDVKREDKERSNKALVESGASTAGQRPGSSSTDQTTPKQSAPITGGSSPFPNYPVPPGTISIPQHIVIPPQPNRTAGQPQKYQINSEITISYSDKSAHTSDAETRRPQQTPHVRQLPTPLTPVVTAPSPQSMISTTAVATQTKKERNGGGSSGGDSKSHGSTAV